MSVEKSKPLFPHPCLQRLGVSVSRDSHRGDSGHRQGESKTVLQGVPGSERKGGTGMSALSFAFHRRGSREH